MLEGLIAATPRLWSAETTRDRLVWDGVDYITRLASTLDDHVCEGSDDRCDKPRTGEPGIRPGPATRAPRTHKRAQGKFAHLPPP